MSNYTACVYRITEKQAREYGTGMWVQEKEREFSALGMQDSKYFTDKLGKPVELGTPAELYRHRSGINVQVTYDGKGQVCSIHLSDPARQRIDRSSSRLLVVADELVPNSLRGSFLGRTGEIGNCISLEYKDYERVLIQINDDFCYEQWVRVLFKRPSCGKPPQIRGLAPTRKP